MGTLGSWQAALVRSLHTRGFWGTVRHAAGLPARLGRVRWVWWRLDNPWLRYMDRQFDRRFGVDTAGVVDTYGPTHARAFLRMLRRVEVDHADYVFIDMGCGKGKAMLLASALPFKRVIGVERAPALLQTAERNAAAYASRTGRRSAFELVGQDAALFRIPDDPAVFYFFNPFQAETMRAVLANIGRSLAAAPRESYVIYHYPVLRSLFDTCGFLTPIRDTSLYVIYRTARGARRGPDV